MTKKYWTLVFSIFLLAGCGPAETIMPEGDLTDEQKAAIKAEDEQVDAEEGAEL